MPIPSENREVTFITHIPCERGKCNVASKLAIAVAKSLNREYVFAELHGDKSSMKELTIEQKIPEWERLYTSEGCVTITGLLKDRVAVIIDDLYQSGATMWCYAKYLKMQGVKYVMGLPCVKSMRDTDNQ